MGIQGASSPPKIKGEMFIMTNKINLREGLNQINVTGTLKENNLEIRDDLKDRRTGAPYTAIMGDLVVKVGENDEHRLKFFSKELTNAGGENKLFKAYKTVKETYISIAEAAVMNTEREEIRNAEIARAEAQLEAGEIEQMPEFDEIEKVYPTRLNVQGEIRSNDYSADGIKVSETPELAGRFINSLKKEEEDRAEFDLEIYVEDMKPELDKDGIETDRLEVKALVPVYGGKVIPVPLKVTGEHGVADYMGMNFRKGDTLQVWGTLINKAIEKIEVKSGFGQSKEKVTYDYTNEILIVGGEENALEGEKAFDATEIAKAKVAREAMLEQEKVKGSQRGVQPKKTSGFGKVAGNTTKTQKPKRDIDADDIPF